MTPNLSLLQSVVDEALQEFEVPGLAVAVVQDDIVVLAQGYRACTQGASAPVDEHTLFAISSISKAFTAACLALLPVIPPGLVTFPLNAHRAVTALQFEQPKLLDADFAELDFRRVQPVAAPVAGG